MEENLAPLAPAPEQRDPSAWSAAVKDQARALGAELVGITPMRPEWVFEGFEITHQWVVVMGIAMDYAEQSTAPHPRSIAEVVRQYGRGTQVAKRLASWLRTKGWDGLPHGGPEAGPILMIPPALACGFGELGKDGSIINRDLGSCFRLAYVLTDVPLVADAPDAFGADEFCMNCRVCEKACPPAAITPTKHLVRGETKWYVDFDKCVPTSTTPPAAASALRSVRGAAPASRPTWCRNSPVAVSGKARLARSNCGCLRFVGRAHRACRRTMHSSTHRGWRRGPFARSTHHAGRFRRCARPSTR